MPLVCRFLADKFRNFRLFISLTAEVCEKLLCSQFHTSTTMSKQFHTLKVSKVEQETKDCVSVSFHIPAELSETFLYKQGQYLTLRFHIKGQDVRRAYSMSSSPLEAEISVTVKKVPGGLVSTFINEQLKAGAEVEVMPPQGRFFAELDAAQHKSYYLFGAGSGITPLMSILKTILEKEPKSTVHLLYGNRDEEGIIFKTKLDQLVQRYAGQLVVEHILSQPQKEKGKGLSGLFKKAKTSWPGKTGRIGKPQVIEFLNNHPVRATASAYFICGPNTMIDTVQEVLLGQGIASEHIHQEHFTANPAPKKAETGAGIDGARLVARLDGERIETSLPEGKTVLDALLDLNYEPPYSCTSGSCSTCMAKVLKGSVSMDECYALDDDEIEEGYVLTCQARPTSPEVEITYDI